MTRPVERQPQMASWKDMSGRARSSHFELLKRRTEAVIAPDLYPDEKGSIAGMLAGVKPGVKLSLERDWDLNRLKRLLNSERVDIIILDNLIVDTKQLKKRLLKERGLAQELGWDFSQSLEENLQNISTKKEASIKGQSLAGFVLDYPESAIKGYKKREEICQEGIPRILDFCDSNKKIDISNWETDDVDFLQTMRQMFKMVYNEYQQTKNSRLLEEKLFLFRKSYKVGIAKLYKKYFNLSETQINFLLSEREVDIYNQQGDKIYYFVDFYTNNKEPEDVRILRDKVNESFEDL